MILTKNLTASFGKALYFAAWGAVGGLIGLLACFPLYVGWTVFIDFYHTDTPASLAVECITTWALLGAGTSVALLGAFSQYLKCGFQFRQAFKSGVLPGLLAGGIAGGIVVVMPHKEGVNYFALVIAWGINGSLLGLGLSFRIPNLGRWRGAGGGLIGGLLAGGVFESVAATRSAVAILFGEAIQGFFIGLMIVIVEVAFRQAWLEIRYGAKESRTVGLGPQPISIGSDASKCTVYAQNAPPVAHRYRLTQGQIVCDDIRSGTTRSLQPGEQQTVGNLTVVVHTSNPPTSLTYSNRASSAQAYPASSPPPYLGVPPQPRSQFALQLKRQVIPLTAGTQLRAQEIPGLEPQAADGVVAQVNSNPNDPTVLGLKNCSVRAWVATLTSGEVRQIESGRSVKLAAGISINFGSVAGKIQHK